VKHWSWVKSQTNYRFSKTKDFFKNFFFESLVISVMVLITISTLLFQNRVIGWEKGHHGWVSSHGLAIISKANWENHFVGYALSYVDNENNKDYDYFDRYPIFFGALVNAALSLNENLSTKIYTAKQVMNLIYIMTLFISFLIVKRFVEKIVALAATVLAFSNPMLLYYKDMFHFDQPALFGFLLLMFSILIYKLDGKKRLLYLSAFVSVALGRGYASWAVMALWFLFETISIFRIRDLIFLEKVKQVVRHDSLIIMVIGVIWGTSLLSYNVLIEANKRNVPITRTSILISARKNLSLSEEFNEKNDKLTNWSYFTRVQIRRIIRWTIPVHLQDLIDPINIAIFVLMMLPVAIYIWKETSQKRIVLLIMTLSGFVWLFPMRSMAAPHEYTTMYYLGLSLVFYLSIFSFLKPSRKPASYLLVFTAIIFVTGILNVRDLHLEQARKDNVDQYTYDFMRIKELIEGEGNNIYWANGVKSVKYAPYAPGFYLPDQFISHFGLADYVLSRNRDFLPNNLTPENFKMFLFKP